MFWASEEFAPKCIIDGEPVNKWLQRHFVSAYAQWVQCHPFIHSSENSSDSYSLAKRIQEAGGLYDDCLIGWDSMNEPHEGMIGIPDLNTFPESQPFR